MGLATVRYMATSEAVEAFPGLAMALAAPQQRMSPSATYLATEAFQTLQVAGNRVVVEVTLHHAVQPLTQNVDRFMPAAHQRSPKGSQRHPHPLLHREAKQAEPALASRAAAVCKAQKIEGFWPSLPPFATLGGRKSTKLDESSLIGVQGQTELAHTRLQIMQEALCRRLAFEAEHTVIGIANHNDLTRGMRSAPLMNPQIEDVV